MTTKKIRKTPIDKLPDALAATVKQLQKKGGTALTLAGKLKCSKPTVYARLAKLTDVHGYTFKIEEVRDGSKGPLAKHYSLRAR